MGAVGEVLRRGLVEGLGVSNGSVSDSSEELHVLAVDDSFVDRKVVERLLKISSCKVTAVESGTRALQYLGLDGENTSSVGFNGSSAFSEIPKGKDDGLCISKGGHFPPFSSEGKPPKRVGRGSKDLTLCRVFRKRTCCSAAQTHPALLAIKSLALTGEASEECSSDLLQCSSWLAICCQNITACFLLLSIFVRNDKFIK